MTKAQVIAGMKRVIKEYAEKYNLTVSAEKYGTGFDNTFWKNVLTDDSGIPNIKAENDTMKVELRSFWGTPELDVRKRGCLLVLGYSETTTGTDNYAPYELRVDCFDYAEAIRELHTIISKIAESDKSD